MMPPEQIQLVEKIFPWLTSDCWMTNGCGATRAVEAVGQYCGLLERGPLLGP
jgi:hypothetical protein